MRITESNRKLINSGCVLRTNYGITSFKLFGNVYSTNPRRTKIYSFDDASWRLTNHGIFWRIKMVLFGYAHKLQGSWE